MAAEPLTTRRSFIAVLAILYPLLSLAAFASSSRVIFLILSPLRSMDAILGVVVFVALHCLLGPIGFLAYATRGWGYGSYAHWSIVTPALVLYALATAVLIGSLVLATRSSRIARWVGYVAGAITWIGSGLLMSFILAYGA
jgi:hypothetical protein